MNYEDKLLLTKMRIQQWYEHWNGQVYVAFSGGKDSTVLLHIVRSMYPDVIAVFNNTGLEFPEIKQFVKSVDNVVWLKPKMNYQEVVRHHGFAIISKENAQKIRDIRLNGGISKNGKLYGKLPNKWRFMVDAPFKISEKCCDVLKKNPAKLYEKETGLKPMVGVMGSESSTRAVNAKINPCNAYDIKRPVSKPLNKWAEVDIYKYIDENNIKISEIYSMGYERTGCVNCMFGLHLEKGENRLQKLRRTHPKIHSYIINKMGAKEVLDYLDLQY